MDNDNGALIKFGSISVKRESGYVNEAPATNAPQSWEKVDGEWLSDEYPIVLKGRYEGRILEIVYDEEADLNVMTPEITAIYQP